MKVWATLPFWKLLWKSIELLSVTALTFVITMTTKGSHCTVGITLNIGRCKEPSICTLRMDFIRQPMKQKTFFFKQRQLSFLLRKCFWNTLLFQESKWENTGRLYSYLSIWSICKHILLVWEEFELFKY